FGVSTHPITTNYNYQKYHYQPPPPPPTTPPPPTEAQNPSALWLLSQASVHRELNRIATGLRRTDDPSVSPCLFAVLPKTILGLFSAGANASASASASASTSAATEKAAALRAINNNNSRTSDEDSDEDDFWLYFLCDCGFMTPESTLLSLHVCSPPPELPPLAAFSPLFLYPSQPSPRTRNNGVHSHGGHSASHYSHRVISPPATVYPGGYQLKDLDKFVEENALPMLSLLYLTNEDPAWIRGGIRFLAERCREDLWDMDASRCKASRRGWSPGMGVDSIDSDEDLDQDQGEGDMTDDVEVEDDEDEDEDEEEGDEEAEGRLMMLREDDFRDPYRAAGKSCSSDDNIVDLNRDQATGISSSITATEQSSTGGAGGLVLGADVLCQVNFPYIEGGILWLCEAHNEMLCKGMAAAKLRDFIHTKGGHCIPMEKSAEIQLQTREDARVFYGMLDEYKCVIKLKVGFEWEGGVTEEDLWELCAAVHSSTVRDLTIDCAGIGAGAGLGKDADGSGLLTFRPMLGMMCRLGFTTLTVENFDGLFLSPEEPLFTLRGDSRRSSRSNSSTNFHHHHETDTNSTSGDPQFSLQDFRMAPTIMALPDNIQVKKLTFRHWARVPDRGAIVNLIKVLPNLTELETMTDSVELLCASIQEELQLQALAGGDLRARSVLHHHPLSHLNLLEVGPIGSKVELTLSKPSGPHCAIRIQETQWKSSKAPDSWLLQSAIGLETLELTQCVRLWERGAELQRIVGCNYSTLRRVEIVCSTDQMANVWAFLRSEFVRPTRLPSPAAAGGERGSSSSPTGSPHGRRTSAGSDSSIHHRHRRPVHLRIYDCAGHSLESSDVEQQRDETILQLDHYDDSFRAQLELQCRIASRLRVSQELTDLAQLAQLSRDAHQAGWEFRPYELVVCLTRVSAIWDLMDQLPMLALTVQMDNGYNRGGGQETMEEDQVPRPQDMPRQLLTAFARLRRVDIGRVWNERFERWMQELLVQEMLPIWKNVTLPAGLPFQGGFVFSAAESLARTDASSMGSKGGRTTAAGVVYSLTHYH
ncbi:MAG: LOW QUALITY PROTEIN: hypothetical protein J3R72DRAFT_453335, partial [Linnemannia gamsii]